MKKYNYSLTDRMNCSEQINNKVKNQGGYGRNYKIAAAIILMLVFLMIISSCGSGIKEADDGRITVYTSFYVMYDFASKIGGERVNIINMVPAGMEPHDWEPSPRDIAGLSEADLFIYSGAGMEGWVDKILGAVNNRNLVAVETSKGIDILKSYHFHEDSEEEPGHSHDEHIYDPHVWLNPINAKMQMKAIKDALIQVDVMNRDFYEKNYNYYAEKLDELDKKYREAVSSFSRKEIVVSHAAYGYLCDAYGLEQYALDSITGGEPTGAKMGEIVEFIRNHDIKVIFYDGLSSSKAADVIAAETGIRTAVLNAIEGLSAEDLKAGKDYFSVMEENLKALSEALSQGE